jgi:hypothetical protein
LGKVVLTYEQPGDIRSGENKVIRAGAGGGGTTNYNDLENKPSINDVTLAGNKTSADLGLLDVDQGTANEGKVMQVNSEGNLVPSDLPTYSINDVTLSGNKTSSDLGLVDANQGTENEGKVMQVNSSGMVVPATLPTPTPSADKVSYDSTPSILSGDDVEEALDSVDNRFSQIGRLQYHLPEWTKKIKYIKVDTIDHYGSGAYFGEDADFVDAYPPDKNVYSEYFLNNVQYTLGNNTYKAGPFYSTYSDTSVQLCWTFSDFIDIEKTPYLLLHSDSGSGEPYSDSRYKPTRLRFKFSEDNQIWNEFTVDMTQMPTYHVKFSGAPSGYTTYFYVYIDVREFVGTDSTLIVNNTCKEISYEDYLALSDAEKMNGTAYYINDLDIEGEEHRISTTEQMVDVFVDGKPVYERLIQFNETIDLDVKESSVILENAGFIENLVGAIGMGADNGSVCSPELFLNGTNLVAANPFPFDAKYVILRYTKTADEPLPEGVGRSDGGLADPIHVYSTEERFVGKWIDGKNIYEKTFEFDTELEVKTIWTDTNILSNYFNTIITALAIRSTGSNYCIDVNIGTTYIQLQRYERTPIKKLVLQYTKRTT